MDAEYINEVFVSVEEPYLEDRKHKSQSRGYIPITSHPQPSSATTTTANHLYGVTNEMSGIDPHDLDEVDLEQSGHDTPDHLASFEERVASLEVELSSCSHALSTAEGDITLLMTVCERAATVDDEVGFLLRQNERLSGCDILGVSTLALRIASCAALGRGLRSWSERAVSALVKSRNGLFDVCYREVRKRSERLAGQLEVADVTFGLPQGIMTDWRLLGVRVMLKQRSETMATLTTIANDVARRSVFLDKLLAKQEALRRASQLGEYAEEQVGRCLQNKAGAELEMGRVRAVEKMQTSSWRRCAGMVGLSVAIGMLTVVVVLRLV